MTILDEIKLQIAELERDVAQPLPPFNYGRDLSCTSDLADDMAETDPDSPVGISEALVRRWTCPRGQNADDPDYGYDVRQLLNRGMTQAELLAQAGLMRGEGEKEETVDTCEVSLVSDSLGRTIRVSARVVPVNPALQPFRFAVAVTDGATMLEIQR